MQPRRLRFTPVELKARHDGWTPERQRRFIEVLAESRSIATACRAVGMSRASAYKLRDHPEASEFRSAWDKALKPDVLAETRRPPRSLQRLRRLDRRRKVDEIEEMDGPPDSPIASPSTLSALATLQTLLSQLRSDECPSSRGDL